MRQLPLEVRLADHAVFDSFLPRGNEALVHALGQLAAEPRPAVLWCWGPGAAGKTHLLQACVAAAAQAETVAAYLPLGADNDLTPDSVASFGSVSVLCVDDVHRVAGDSRWEQSLFRLYEDLRLAGGRLVMAATHPVAESGFLLPDLASRCAAGATYRVAPLDDAGRLAALTLRARFRGFELPADTGRYLLDRVPRDTGSLFRLLDELDRASLQAQKRLTIPFVRQVLADAGMPPDAGSRPGP